MSSPPNPSAPAGYPTLRRVGDFLFAWRNLIFSAVTILFLAALPPRPFGGGAAMDRILDLVGVGITVFGQALRMAVIGFAYIKRGGTEGKVDAQRLVTEGFFNHCRNPLYVGNILIVAGLVVVHNNPIAYLLIPLACFGYSAIVCAEEGFLEEKFGEEYRAYCLRVPRWVPRLKGLRATTRSMEFNWMRVLYKEYTTTYSWILGLLAILGYQVMTSPTAPASRAAFFWQLGGVAAALTAAWAVIRYFKKTQRRRRRLREQAAG